MVWCNYKPYCDVLITGKMIDWFKVEAVVRGISFSPNGEFLATVHENNLGIYLWSNNAHFNTIFLQPPPQTPSVISMPRSTRDVLDLEGEEESDDHDGDDIEDESHLEDGEDSSTANESVNSVGNNKRIEELSAELPNIGKLLSYSNAPRSRFKTLINLDIIKVRSIILHPLLLLLSPQI
jgi:U3 small nucleolar RNA-associated protein 21